MYVAPETLRMHIEVAREFFDIVHLDDWLAAEKAGKANRRPACALTFDDGWRDNFDFAFPILQQTNTPAAAQVVGGVEPSLRQIDQSNIVDL
jgi:peptidoglycan/xylan/chitin deacetylase (PgdA/CDA1 family)